MKAHRLANVALATIIAGSFAALLSTSHLLDKEPDRRAEFTQSGALADAQKAAQAEARIERAAAQLCARRHGNAGYRWSEDNSLICTDHRGRTLTAKAAP